MTSSVVAASSFCAAPAKDRMAVGVTPTKHKGDSPSRELAGLLLALPRPHGRVCGEANRHRRKRSVTGIPRTHRGPQPPH
eukprot:10478504-Prorocentrum_lima.AAC.1